MTYHWLCWLLFMSSIPTYILMYSTSNKLCLYTCRPEDRLRCRQGVKLPRNSTQLNFNTSREIFASVKWRYLFKGGLPPSHEPRYLPCVMQQVVQCIIAYQHKFNSWHGAKSCVEEENTLCCTQCTYYRAAYFSVWVCVCLPSEVLGSQPNQLCAGVDISVITKRKLLAGFKVFLFNK